MTEQKPNNPWPIIAIIVIAAVLLWPSVKGCAPSFHGLEIGTWIGKVTVKPVVPPKPIDPPKTRCLVFGFSSCPACKTLHKTIRWKVVPQGWKLGPLPTDDIEEIDIYSNDRRIKKYKHSSYPTLIIVDRDEKEVDRRTGAMSGEQLITWIQSTR